VEIGDYDRGMRWVLLLMLAGCERSASADPKPPIPWPEDLIGHPDLVGNNVTVDVFEPLLDAEHSSGAHGDGYDIEVIDVGAERFNLVSGSLKLPKKLRPPVRVEGRLEEAPHGIQIAVSKLTPLSWPKPEHIAHAADIMADKKHFSRRYVDFEDDYMVGFEGSYLGPLARGKPAIWLNMFDGVEIHCEPVWPKDAMSGPTYHRVKVEGMAHTNGRYGHMSGSDGLIVATKITYLPCAK